MPSSQWALVVGMLGVTYAAVPLYRMFCQATGFGGTVIEGQAVEEKLRRRVLSRDEQLERACAAREITVSFNADVDDSLPWRFKPTQRSVKVHPGQSTLAFYTAHNNSDKAVTGISTYNVVPQEVGGYFNKIQCFCFEVGQQSGGSWCCRRPCWLHRQPALHVWAVSCLALVQPWHLRALRHAPAPGGAGAEATARGDN